MMASSCCGVGDRCDKKENQSIGWLPANIQGIADNEQVEVAYGVVSCWDSMIEKKQQRIQKNKTERVV